MIPTTILTGFLGAGKTTLLKKILNEFHGSRLAIIENEYGAESIDNEILLKDNEKIVELSNGCICCNIHGDLIQALLQLKEKRDIGKIFFERIIIETTGLADPTPICQTFFADNEIAENFRLDAIITVVDAKHGMQTLDTQNCSQKQIGFADRILISKKDLVTNEKYKNLYSRLTRINPQALISSVNFGKIDLKLILNVNGFNLDEILELNPDFLEKESSEKKCNHLLNSNYSAHKNHNDEIGTFVFRSNKPFESQLLEEFLEKMVQTYGPDLFRYKGILYIRGMTCRMLLQGVHMMIGTEPGEQWLFSEQPSTKMVFIGRKLPNDIILQGLENCLSEIKNY